MIDEGDQARITRAIHDAESTTTGEIFCVIAKSSSDHPWAPAALMPAIWAAVVALLAPWPLMAFTGLSAVPIYGVQIMLFVAAILVLRLPALRHRLTPRRMGHERAHHMAQHQFAAHGLHKTSERTGVLIFASQAERYAEIVADTGINEKVDAQVWRGAIADLLAAIKAERPADGFVAAVERCGAVLAEHFPLPPGAAHRPQLPDRLIEI
jgi:putative membrane protein